MLITNIKAYISRFNLLKVVLDPVLNVYVVIRALIRGGFSQHGEDLVVSRFVRNQLGIELKDIRYFDIGANHYMRSNNSFLFYKQGGRAPWLRQIHCFVNN